jgi:EpsD family peptidyl-prolyl cis-trans isomerase
MPASRVAVVAVTLLTVLLVAGCSDKQKDKLATQTAARVNREEITVHQINFVLQQQRGIAPEQAASASKQVLERLIDQELALQKASEQKLDRDPKVVQQIEAARRDIVARAYLDKIGAGAPKPSPEEISAYYEANPALFRERRVYNLQELAIEAKPEQLDDLKAKLVAAKDVPAFLEYLKANNIRFVANQAVRPAEQLPLASLATISKMKDGQAIFNPAPNGVLVIILAGSRTQPVDEAHARPAIEQYLLNERKRKVVEDDLKALRSASKIEYVGDFTKTPEELKAAAAKDKAALEVKPGTSALTAPASAPPIVPIVPIASSPLMSAAASAPLIVPVKAASIPSGKQLDQGIKGLK